MPSRTLARLAAILVLLLTSPSQTRAAEVKVAVAANFTEALRAIAPLYERATGHRLVASFGSTGLLFAQIRQGAPFDVLLAADQTTPAKAVAEGLAVAGTQVTYAVGRLALFSTIPGHVTGPETLRAAPFARLAIANPATAPYGAAAIETLRALGVYDALADRLVLGQNIGQAFQFVRTGNAEAGFVALAQIAFLDGGSRWVVPAELHAPIRQDAVLLAHARGNAAATAFLAFLDAREAREVIARFGYAITRRHRE